MLPPWKGLPCLVVLALLLELDLCLTELLFGPDQPQQETISIQARILSTMEIYTYYSYCFVVHSIVNLLPRQYANKYILLNSFLVCAKHNEMQSWAKHDLVPSELIGQTGKSGKVHRLPEPRSSILSFSLFSLLGEAWLDSVTFVFVCLFVRFVLQFQLLLIIVFLNLSSSQSVLFDP